MSRQTKIAPALTTLSRGGWNFMDVGESRDLVGSEYVKAESAMREQASAELRALLAVASAAERDLDGVAEMLHLPRSTMEAIGTDTTAKLARALSRLRSLSSHSKPGASRAKPQKGRP